MRMTRAKVLGVIFCIPVCRLGSGFGFVQKNIAYPLQILDLPQTTNLSRGRRSPIGHYEGGCAVGGTVCGDVLGRASSIL
jgi:hypothetical protein